MNVRIQPEFPRNMRWPNDSERGRVSPEGTIDGLVALYSELCPKGGRGVEIGCWSGESAEIGCQFLSLLVCVDPFEPPNWHMNEPLFDQRTAAYPHILKIKKHSHDAAALFDDNTFDWIYLDGQHDEENVTRDIRDWLPKIKMGGWVTGHDYDSNADHVGVTAAVDAMLGPPSHQYSDSSWAFQKTAELVAKAAKQ